MSAATFKIRTEHKRSGTLTACSGGDLLSSRIGVHLREQRCPSCNSIVYTRRHSRCGVCEQELPERVRFTSDEADKVNGLLKIERQRHRVWLMKAEAGGH